MKLASNLSSAWLIPSRNLHHRSIPLSLRGILLSTLPISFRALALALALALASAIAGILLPFVFALPLGCRRVGLRCGYEPQRRPPVVPRLLPRREPRPPGALAVCSGNRDGTRGVFFLKKNCEGRLHVNLELYAGVRSLTSLRRGCGSGLLPRRPRWPVLSDRNTAPLSA